MMRFGLIWLIEHSKKDTAVQYMWMASLRGIQRELYGSLSPQKELVRGVSATAGKHQAESTVGASNKDSDRSHGSGGTNSGWMPNWLKSRLPGALGGDKDDISSLENMSLDSFASNVRRARRLGSLTGFVHGTSKVSDSSVQGSLRTFENIIEAMQDHEKEDLKKFDATARRRVAETVGCSVQQVDDCIARYVFFSGMTKKLAELRRQGKEMPKSIEELEQLIGNWRQYRPYETGSAGMDAQGSAGGDRQTGVMNDQSRSSGVFIPLEAVDSKGRPCGLAGMQVGRNTRCPVGGKSFKNCCGKAK